MILCRATIDDNQYRMSPYGAELENPWFPWVKIDNPQYSAETAHGGYVSLNFGKAKFKNDLFANHWPPPKAFGIELLETQTNEAGAVTLLTGTARRAGIRTAFVPYDLFGPAYDVPALDEADGYEGKPVSLPRAFGPIKHVNPVRLADRDGKPTYHNGYVSGAVGIDWHVYDDGVLIDSNVTDNGDGTFSLDAVPVGELTESGIGEVVTLADAAQWGGGRIGLSDDTGAARDPSPELGTWWTDKGTVVECLSELSAWLVHLYNIEGGWLTLVDMRRETAFRTYRDFEFFPGDHDDQPAYSRVVARWKRRIAVPERYVRDDAQEEKADTDEPYGEPYDVTPYHWDNDKVLAALADIRDVLTMAEISAGFPMEGNRILPGDVVGLDITTSLYKPSFGKMVADAVTYDFNRYTMRVDGKGIVA